MKLKSPVLAVFIGCALFARGAAAGPETGKTWNLPLSDAAGLELAWIPPGSFAMGSPETEAGRKPDEGPLMHVTLTRGF